MAERAEELRKVQYLGACPKKPLFRETFFTGIFYPKPAGRATVKQISQTLICYNQKIVLFGACFALIFACPVVNARVAILNESKMSFFVSIP